MGVEWAAIAEWERHLMREERRRAGMGREGGERGYCG
jgi:hypothetical protein